MPYSMSDIINNHRRSRSSRYDPTLHAPTTSRVTAQSHQPVQQQLILRQSMAVVPGPPIPDPVLVLPSTPSLGQDNTFEEVCGYLIDNNVGTIGIYGMGGIGKTKLLKTINNELEGSDFDVVIWVVVSKKMNMDRIRKTILERLGLSHCGEENNDQMAIFKALRRRKFALLFDDLWDRLDLEDLGVPTVSENGSKVVFTTRLEDVCGQMRSVKNIKVNCLSWEESWVLFREYVGEEVLDSHSEIQDLAKKVAKECGGLPLALIVIARAMTSTRTPQEWKHALATLRNAPSEIPGTEKELYYRLKFSYDMLPNDTMRNCFIYCSLFPEDDSLNKWKLIKYWIAEGFLGCCENIDEAENKGYNIIGTLKRSCLLESLTDDEDVQMHDVLRDMALWVASECGLNKGKFLVKAGAGLHKSPEAEKWRESERISLMNNKMTELSVTPDCPKLLTLMLQCNRDLQILSETFFQFMPHLRVLDLSNTGLMVLPSSIGQLVELQYLNISGTYLGKVPKEIGDLQNLRYLDMSNIHNKPPFRPEKNSLTKVVYHILVSGYSIYNPNYDESNICQLERLEFLSDLSVSIQNNSSLICLISSHKLAKCITNLWIFTCQDMSCLQLRSSFGTRLRTLHIGRCDSLEHIDVGGTNLDRECQILPSIEVLRLEYNSKLKRVRVGNSLGQCLRQLTTLVIDGCCLLEDIGWVKYLQSLEYFKIRANNVMEKLFSSQDEAEDGLIAFPKLKQLHIKHLEELKRICTDVVIFPSLESLKVYGCPNLEKLPLGLLNEKRTLRTIRGDEEWWNNLEWLDDNIKSQFQPYFKTKDV